MSNRSSAIARFLHLSPLALILVVSTTGAEPAAADLSYTLTVDLTSAAGGADGAGPANPSTWIPKISTTFYYHADQQRTDMSIALPVLSRKTDVINDCSGGKTYTLDPTLNIYSVSDMSSSAPDPFGFSALAAGMPGAARGATAHGRDDEAGTVTVNVSVADKGTEQINGALARHWSLTTTETATGTAHATKGAHTFDIWTDSTARPLSCAEKSALGGADAAASTGKVKYSYTGDVDAMKTVMTTVPVRMRFEAGPGKSVTLDRINLSTADLDPSLFAPPSDAKKVTDSEYQSQERDALLHGFEGMRGGTPAN